jgi:hypothetical protein
LDGSTRGNLRVETSRVGSVQKASGRIMAYPRYTKAATVKIAVR